MTTKQFQIFKEFTERMKSEMEANAHKGEWVHWRNQNDILREIEHHLYKLAQAIRECGKLDIREFSADVANIAMFMYNSTSPTVNNPCKHCEDSTDPEKPWLDCPMCCGSGIIES